MLCFGVVFRISSGHTAVLFYYFGFIIESRQNVTRNKSGDDTSHTTQRLMKWRKYLYSGHVSVCYLKPRITQMGQSINCNKSEAGPFPLETCFMLQNRILVGDQQMKQQQLAIDIFIKVVLFPFQQHILTFFFLTEKKGIRHVYDIDRTSTTIVLPVPSR